MSEWAYVAIAYGAVWGSLAFYALLLARRVTQGRNVERQLREGIASAAEIEAQDSKVCDVPPGP